MSTIIILVIGAIIFTGLFFGFKYFVKTTSVVIIFIIGMLVRDYQYTRLPEKYSRLQTEEGFFDQKRNIVSEDQDQYIKLVKMINDYNTAINGIKDGGGDQGQINVFDQFEKLNRDYTTIGSKTGSSLEGFINQNMSAILKFETEILQNTTISGLNDVLSGGIRGDADPARNVEYQMERDVPQGSNGLIRNLIMIGSAYCYRYGLQQTGDDASIAKEKCINYFDQASKITRHFHDRKGVFILGLISSVNQNNILQSFQLLGSGGHMQYLKPIIKKNLNFLGSQDTKEIMREYMINDHNVSFMSAIKDIGEVMNSDGLNQGLGWLFDPYKGNYFINKKRIIDGVKQRSADWGEYFYSFYRPGSVLEIGRPVLMGEYRDKGQYSRNLCIKGGVKVACDESSSLYYLDREINVLAEELSSNSFIESFLSLFEKDKYYYYGNSLSRGLLSILGLDDGEYLINVISAKVIIVVVPRVGIEKNIVKNKDLYLELTK